MWESVVKGKEERQKIPNALRRSERFSYNLPTNDIVSQSRRTRKHRSMAFQIPLAGTDI